MSVLSKFALIPLLLGVTYSAACLFLYLRQTRMIFFPIAAIDTTPADFGVAYEQVRLALPNQPTQQLHGWWMPAPSKTATSSDVVLYLHGNGVNIGANAAHAYRFHQMGFAVLLMDYRGYGQSTGQFPSEAAVYEDAAAMWQYLVEQRQIAPERIFIYGHSLGGAIAIELATHNPDAAGLIVQSSFTSIREMVDRTMNLRWIPVDLILTQRFDSLRKVPALDVPVLFIHGTADAEVPAEMSRILYDAAPDPKHLWLVPTAGHNDVADIAGMDYFQQVTEFVRQAKGEAIGVPH